MIASNMKEVAALEGSVAILECSVTASPLPTVTWYKGDNPVEVNLPYRNDPKFLDRYACANGADPDELEQSDQGLHCWSSLIRVCTVCNSICIVWTHYSMVESHISNFRVITTNFLGVRIFRKIYSTNKKLFGGTVKSEKVATPKQFAVIIIKFEHGDFTIRYYVQKL